MGPGPCPPTRQHRAPPGPMGFSTGTAALWPCLHATHIGPGALVPRMDPQTRHTFDILLGPRRNQLPRAAGTGDHAEGLKTPELFSHSSGGPKSEISGRRVWFLLGHLLHGPLLVCGAAGVFGVGWLASPNLCPRLSCFPFFSKAVTGLRGRPECSHPEVLTLTICAKALIPNEVTIRGSGGTSQFNLSPSALWPPKLHIHPVCQIHSPQPNVPQSLSP